MLPRIRRGGVRETEHGLRMGIGSVYLQLAARGSAAPPSTREECCDWKLPANCSHGAGVDKLLNIKRCPVASGTAASQERD